MAFRAALAAMLLLLGAARAEPARVLSLNLCTDQLVLALADPAQVAGVSLLARDCSISAECAAAARVPAVRGLAEEVIALHPDLVLAGHAGAGPALAAARRLGVPVLTLDDPTTLAGIGEQITLVAAALGQQGRGATLLARFETKLAAIPQRDGSRPVAAIYQPNGASVSAGTLADAVLARAGFANYMTRERLRRYARIPLEYLVLHPPDLLVTDAPSPAPSLAEAMLWHPALLEGFAGRRVEIPARDLICGSPATLDAVERLTRARQ